jgi:hypothetical protein
MSPLLAVHRPKTRNVIVTDLSQLQTDKTTLDRTRIVTTPIANHLVVQPVRVGDRGFYDGTPHRLELTSAYNQYQRIRSDAAYRVEDENYQAVLRPLFITSFMLADFLEP